MQLWVWSNRVCAFVSDVTDVNDKYFEIPPWKLTYLLKMDGWKMNVPFKDSPFLDIFCYIFSVKKDVSFCITQDRRGRELRKPAGWGWRLSLPSAWAAGDMGWKTRKIWGEDAWIGQRSMDSPEWAPQKFRLFFEILRSVTGEVFQNRCSDIAFKYLPILFVGVFCFQFQFKQQVAVILLYHRSIRSVPQFSNNFP